MPTQRPYFANFLAAFRAHSVLKSTSSSSATAAPQTSYSSLSTTQQQTQQPQQQTTPQAQSALPQTTPTRPITSKTTQASLAAAAAAFSPPTSHHHTRHTSNIPVPVPKTQSPTGPYGSGGRFGGRARRGSDSSSEGGFRDALGGEKWFIGGRTASGEERFYGLAMVRRERSGERASVDRMSL